MGPQGHYELRESGTAAKKMKYDPGLEKWRRGRMI